MSIRTIIKVLPGACVVAAVGFELGLFQRVIDSRSVVEDGVVGSDYWIVQVDGRSTERIRHGLLITNVPLALLEPGDRVLKLSAEPDTSADKELVEFHATIEKGVNYRISRNTKGIPELFTTKR